MAAEFSFANAAFSVVTIGVSGLVGFLSAKRISSLNMRSKACSEFRAALAVVSVEIKSAKGKPSARLDEVLTSTRQNIAVASEIFRPFVDEGMRAAFDAACREYEEAACLGSEFMYKDDRVAEVNRRVEKLLAHAEYP